jgi:heme-degrading monooxygenase HmoA
MYAVIFRAKTRDLDPEYYETANRLREIAMEKYGCQDFVSVSENGEEITISYWPDLTVIQEWKKDPDHLAAQKVGRAKWYIDYKVEMVEVLRSYESGSIAS